MSKTSTLATRIASQLKIATTPAVVIDPKTGIVYAIYFRGENSGGNIYFMDD